MKYNKNLFRKNNIKISMLLIISIFFSMISGYANSLNVDAAKIDTIYGKINTQYKINVNKKVVWKSDDKKVVSINKQGVLSFKKVGYTYITGKVNGKVKYKILAISSSNAWVLTLPTSNPTAESTSTPNPTKKPEIEETQQPTQETTNTPNPTTTPIVFNDEIIKEYSTTLATLINNEREKVYLNALKTDWEELNRAAQIRAEEMANTDNYLTRPDGSAGYTVLQDVGIIEGVHSGLASAPGYGRFEYQLYNGVHNTEYYNRETPKKAFAYFQSNSRSDMLEFDSTHMGVGVAKSETGIYYWYVIYLRKR